MSWPVGVTLGPGAILEVAPPAAAPGLGLGHREVPPDRPGIRVEVGPDPVAGRSPASEPLVIFDCDGVLVDSESVVTRIEAELLGRIGVVMTPAEVGEAFIGLSDDEMHRRIEARWGVAVPPALIAEKADRIERALRLEVTAVDGIAAVLEQLRAARCIASSSSPERIRATVARAGLDHHFGSHVFSATMVARGKPEPDLFLFAAAAMHARPARCVVVEDSPYGVEAGRAAGMTVVGFTGASHCGPGLPDRLRTAGAARVAGSAAELTAALNDVLGA